MLQLQDAGAHFVAGEFPLVECLAGQHDDRECDRGLVCVSQVVSFPYGETCMCDANELGEIWDLSEPLSYGK